MRFAMPKDPELNARARMRLLWDGGHDPAAAAYMRDRCADDVVFWTNAFCWTYDPRKTERPDLPFVTYPFQDEAILKILDGVMSHRDVGIEKSRDMGASWVNLAVFVWMFQFHPSLSFLVVSRNVTHALREHVTVYREWLRVLRPGGVLLIFDANWHLPQASEEMYLESMEREKKAIEVYGSDFSGNTVFDENAEFAPGKRHPHPLGDLMRPDWDNGILRAVGFESISYDRDITGPLWDDKEKLVYGNTPMFMLRGVKPT